nr:MAG TPA: hypothetical protein [Caudoviricetes sp.]
MARDTEITIPDSYIEDLIELGYRFIFLTSNGGYTVEILVIKDGECEDRKVDFMFSEVMQGRDYMYEKIALEARELIKDTFEKGFADD